MLPAAADGTIKTVVTAMTEEDGGGNVHRQAFAYQGKPVLNTRNWGFLGFPATRVSDLTEGVVTYRKFRLDDPHFATRVAEHRYDRIYNASDTRMKTFSKEVWEYAAHTRKYGAATTTLPFLRRRRSTETHYENGKAVGITRTEWEAINDETQTDDEPAQPALLP